MIILNSLGNYMTINFNAENQDPQISFRLPEPGLSFEKAYKIDGQKFNQIIEPYARGLEREHKGLQNKVAKITKGKDGVLMLFNGGLLGVGAVSFLALAIIFPLGPVMLLTFLGSGRVLGYNYVKDFYKILFKAPAILKKIEHNNELQGILK